LASSCVPMGVPPRNWSVDTQVLASSAARARDSVGELSARSSLLSVVYSQKSSLLVLLLTSHPHQTAPQPPKPSPGSS
jgi:hypothetical protein